MKLYSFGWHRVWAVMLRNLYLYRRSLDRLTDSFFWPFVDLAVWGITSNYIISEGGNLSTLTVVIISGIVLWMFVYRGQFEIGSGLLEDIWNKNLINIFVAPIQFLEWAVSLLLLSLVKTFVSFGFGVLVAFLMYRIDILTLFIHALPYILILILCGICFGFFLTGILLRLGSKVQAFAWMLIWAVAPFCAIYYPITALPHWAQLIAKAIPASYAFEGMREVIHGAGINMELFVPALILTLVYLTLAGIFFYRSFQKVLEKGLVKVF